MNLVLVATTIAFGSWAALSLVLHRRRCQVPVPVETWRSIEARRAARRLR